ncbi:hypothetical protein DM01DRAFT_328697 [Hesseltinella vesiculosa]|uniref:Uncharacterized protein n=1 Tax=Hesseltinella vesiculosa TaxID=101127 RepID=A0A1X2G7B7_9FUNG|nr:hypothetical protein DM01DRAFT_328697 [Hesseltinella vesiculosa]
MVNWKESETALLWLIVTIPIFISLGFFAYIRWVIPLHIFPDEETGTCDCALATIVMVEDESKARFISPPPSYVASQSDRVYHLPTFPSTPIDKPPDYNPNPPSYAYAIGPDDVPLSDIQKRIVDQQFPGCHLLVP